MKRYGVRSITGYIGLSGATGGNLDQAIHGVAFSDIMGNRIDPLSVSAEVGAEVEFTVYGTPAPGGSKTAGVSSKTGRTFVRDSSRRSAPWRADVARAAAAAMEGRELLEGALLLEVAFYLVRPKGHYGARGLRPSAPAFPVTRPDLTKLLRPLEDACTGIVWRDDSAIVVQSARKVYGEPARAVVTVSVIRA